MPSDASRPRSEGYLFMVGIAVAIGLAGAAGAVAFRLLIRLSGALFFGGLPGLEATLAEGLLAEAADPLPLARELSPALLLTLPAIGGLIVGPLVYFFAREARGHGVPEVMEAVALRSGRIRPRVAIVKTLASAITIGSGGSVGREGPIVQIGSASASALGQALRVPARQLRTMVACGAAAGVAATFNAPIAGALFAVEIIVADFAVAQFSPVVISAVVATVASRFLLGNHPAFPVPTYDLVSPFEIVAYMALGVVAAGVAWLFVRAIGWAEDGFSALPVHPALTAALGGLGVGAIGVFLPQVFGVGYTTISGALEGNLPVALLGALLVAKLVATSVTVGSGGSGGVFAPSLFLGAMLGGIFGTLLNQTFPDGTATSGAYALVSMGAMVAATTHAPITAIIMVFELTQSLEIIPPLMAACVVSTLVSTGLSRDSIYTHKLRRRGVELGDRDPNVLKSLFVRDLLDASPEIIPANTSFDGVMDLIVRSRHSEFFVVNDEGHLLGAIYLEEVRRLLHEAEDLRSIVVAADLLEKAVTLRETDDLDAAMQLLSLGRARELAVVDADDPRKLVGSVHERDVMGAYNEEVLRRDLAGGVSSRVSIAGGERQVDLGGGFALEEVPAPRRFLGKSLAELNVRRRGGVQVLLIRNAAAEIRVPGADDVIREGDRLVIAGPRKAIAGVERL